MSVQYVREQPQVHHARAKVLSLRRSEEGFARLVFAAPAIAREARAGQFVSVRCPGESRDLKVFETGEDWATVYLRRPKRAPLAGSPILRRPISIHRIVGAEVELLFNIVGRGTGSLAALEPGDIVDVLGPMGNGFDLTGDYETAVVVAGGAGLAPMPLLLQSLRKLGKELVFIAGAKERFPIHMGTFVRFRARMLLATEIRYEHYYCGLCTDLLERFLNDEPGKRIQVFSCGPWGMLRAVNAICARHGIPVQVSLEQRMGCALGACMACVRKVMDGEAHNVRVCTEGPVFDGKIVVWE